MAFLSWGWDGGADMVGGDGDRVATASKTRNRRARADRASFASEPRPRELHGPSDPLSIHSDLLERDVRYISTRGGAPVDLVASLRHGPAPDGGLYVPATVPPLRAEGSPRAAPTTFAATAARVLMPYLRPELAPDELEELAGRAFDFDVPLVALGDDTWALELTHGPTGAFKDVGARFLAAALARLDPPARARPRTVLVATSGDTGAAVASAFHGLPHTRVLVLFPEGRVSELQRRQLTTLDGDVHAIAVRGPFDACQRLVRGAFADDAIRSRYGLTSANSLNIGRLLPQIVFYVHAAARLRALGERRPPGFVVPSGNLGNLTAGVLAAAMGLEVAGFVAALNANDAFLDVLQGGVPDPATTTVPTLSSAMDVGLPSNVERLSWLARGRPLAAALGIVGISVDDEATRASMARLQRERGYLADPHTAVGFEALRRLRAGGSPAAPVVVLATAHPAKFPEVVASATGVEPKSPPGLAALAGRPERFATIDGDPAALNRVFAELHGAPR